MVVKGKAAGGLGAYKQSSKSPVYGRAKAMPAGERISHVPRTVTFTQDAVSATGIIATSRWKIYGAGAAGTDADRGGGTDRLWRTGASSGAAEVPVPEWRAPFETHLPSQNHAMRKLLRSPGLKPPQADPGCGAGATNQSCRRLPPRASPRLPVSPTGRTRFHCQSRRLREFGPLGGNFPTLSGARQLLRAIKG